MQLWRVQVCERILPEVWCGHGVVDDGEWGGEDGGGAARAEKRWKILMDTTPAE
jgi:hypothetical protein